MRSDGPPLVSIVIPAYNAERTIVTALESVIRQSSQDFEVILCDDGSTDQTVESAKNVLSGIGNQRRSRILSLGGRGAAAARNAGVRAARGELVAFLDDDDRWEPEKLARCVGAIQSQGLDLVCHAEVWEWEDGRRRLRVYSDLFNTRIAPLTSIIRNNPLSTSAVMVRRTRLMAAGLFDESLPSAEDFDLWLRLSILPELKIGFIDEPLGVYAVRSGSESSKVHRRREALLIIGKRFRSRLIRSGPFGNVDYWAYRSRVDVTSGLRYLRGGRPLHGAALAAWGLLRWPFRFDWLRLAWRERRRNSRLSHHTTVPPYA
jgi:glycosyltransferase involved in cell wall biosynthesis